MSIAHSVLSIVLLVSVGACSGDEKGAPGDSRCDAQPCGSDAASGGAGGGHGGASSGGTAGGGHGGVTSGGAAGNGGSGNGGGGASSATQVGYVTCGGETNPSPSPLCDISKHEFCCGYRSPGFGFTVYQCGLPPSPLMCASMAYCDEDGDCPTGETCDTQFLLGFGSTRTCSGNAVPPTDAGVPRDAGTAVLLDAATHDASPRD